MKYILLVCLFIGWKSGAECQDHSHLSIATCRNIELAGKVWGFLKYYHPVVRAGRYDWDHEFLRILPKMYNRPAIERDSILSQWILGLGDPEMEKAASAAGSCAVPRWIDTSGFQSSLVSLLHAVCSLPRGQHSHYVELKDGIKPDFSMEQAYPQLADPDAGYRLLALFRYWNCINYYYPYKHDLLRDWDKILPGQIRQFLSASNELEYKLAILRLITLIHDSHASLEEGASIIDEFNGLNYAPVELIFIDGRPVVKDYYDTATGRSSGLLKGDVLVAVDGAAVSSQIEKRVPVTPASNKAAQMRDIARDLLRTNDTVINVVIQRRDSLLCLKVKCYPSSKMDINIRYNRHDTCLQKLRDNIAYLNPWYLNASAVEGVGRALLGSKAVIIDLRYPVRENMLPLADLFLTKTTVFARLTSPSNDCPGSFGYFRTARVGRAAPKRFHGKIILLVDENTQSSAEFNAMAFRVCDSSMVIGSTTAGADGDVADIALPGGVLTSFTGLGVYYPDKRPTQRVGIRPDIVVKPTVAGVREGRDELLERAIAEAEK